jgi:hypothetical protein
MKNMKEYEEHEGIWENMKEYEEHEGILRT